MHQFFGGLFIGLVIGINLIFCINNTNTKFQYKEDYKKGIGHYVVDQATGKSEFKYFYQTNFSAANKE